MNLFRRLPLGRLLLLIGALIALGAGASAIASALDTGPVPPEKPLAQALHDAAAGERPAGVSASIVLSDHLLEGANLASEGAGSQGGGGLASSPLVTGASGRLWASGGEFRLELQAERGDTELVWNGHALELYDAATDTLYRYTPPAGERDREEGHGTHEAPSVAKIEEAISRVSRHLDVSGAVPADVAGQPAYTVTLSPKEGGSLFAGAQLSFDANNGIPLRAAVYSTASSSPVLELAATEIAFGSVEASVFEINPPEGVKIVEVKPTASAAAHARSQRTRQRAAKPTLTVHGNGPGAIAVIEAKAGNGKAAKALSGLPEVEIAGTKASELRTALGTLLTFERGGVRYLLAGSVRPAALEALASGL